MAKIIQRMVDASERLLFGATAEEAVQRRIVHIDQRVDVALFALLEALDTDADEEELAEEVAGGQTEVCGQWRMRSSVMCEACTEGVDRYEALGINPPDPATMCQGECEGTGYVPVYFSEGDHRDFDLARALFSPSEEDYTRRYYTAWLEAEREQATNDGWHFVKCPDCGGSGKRREDEPR